MNRQFWSDLVLTVGILTIVVGIIMIFYGGVVWAVADIKREMLAQHGVIWESVMRNTEMLKKLYKPL
jgi:hypothetical protein